MLNPAYRAAPRAGAQNPPPARQEGVVLMVALIILVALTIGGIALVRSIDTTSLISGNLAFQQAATRSGEAGTEAAMQRLLATAALTSETFFWQDDVTRAYTASTAATRLALTAGEASTASGWDSYWFSAGGINPNHQVVPGQCSAAGGGRVCVLPVDAVTGNTVSYTIERLCNAPGDPGLVMTSGCARGRQPSASTGNCQGAGCTPLNAPTQYFYRVTTRVEGPRNTSSYIQTIVAR
jgi:type IV pilus assembly protein PilX